MLSLEVEHETPRVTLLRSLFHCSGLGPEPALSARSAREGFDCLCDTLCNQFPLDGHLGCFQTFTINNNYCFLLEGNSAKYSTVFRYVYLVIGLLGIYPKEIIVKKEN